jgi:hypothetical protein
LAVTPNVTLRKVKKNAMMYFKEAIEQANLRRRALVELLRSQRIATDALVAIDQPPTP